MLLRLFGDGPAAVLGRVALLVVMVLGAASVVGAAAAQEAATGFRERYDVYADRLFHGADVQLRDCIAADGTVTPLPEDTKVEGYAAFLHTGHPFSLRTLFWSEINRRLAARGANAGPLTFKTLEDDPDRPEILSQLVVKLLIGDSLRPLVHRVEAGRHVYRPACSAAYDVTATPDIYPTVEIAPIYPREITDDRQAAIRTEILRFLRARTRDGVWLSFFARGDAELSLLGGAPVKRLSLEADTVPLSYFLEGVVKAGEAEFLSANNIAATVTLLGASNPALRDARIVAFPEPGSEEAAQADLSRQLEAAQRTAGDLLGTNRRLEDEVQRLREQAAARAALEVRLTQLQADRQSLQAVIDQLRESLAETSKTEEVLRTQLAEKDAALEAATAATDTAQARVAMLEDSVATRTAERAALEAQLRQSREAGGAIRLVLPAAFQEHDLSQRLQFAPDGPCSAASFRRLDDGLSYQTDCFDPAAKVLSVPGFARLEVAGRTAVVSATDLRLDVPLEGDPGWRRIVDEGEARPPRIAGLTLDALMPEQASSGIYRFHMFPNAPTDNPLAQHCAADLPVAIAAVIDEAILLESAPPCVVTRAAFPPEWFGRPGAAITGCLMAPTAELPWCAQVRGEAGPVVLTVGPGWSPITLDPTALTWEAVRERLAPIWPYGDDNPAAPDLTPRPTYRLAQIIYADASAERLCTVMVGAAADTMPDSDVDPEAVSRLPALGAGDACPIDRFSLAALPTTATLHFVQPPATETLIYWPRVQDRFDIAAAAATGEPRNLSAEHLIGHYPVWLADQGPIAGDEARVHFHDTLAACEQSPVTEAVATAVYRPGGGILQGQTASFDRQAVLASGTQIISQCAQAEPIRLALDVASAAAGNDAEGEDGKDSGAPTVVARFSFEVRRAAGPRSVLILGAMPDPTSTAMTLRTWMESLAERRRRSLPLTVFVAQTDGGVERLLEGEDLERSSMTPLEVIETAMPRLIPPQRSEGMEMRQIEEAYRHLVETGAIEHGLARLVYLGDAGSSLESQYQTALVRAFLRAEGRPRFAVAATDRCDPWVASGLVTTDRCRERGAPVADGADVDAETEGEGEGVAAGMNDALPEQADALNGFLDEMLVQRDWTGSAQVGAAP